MKTKIVYVVTSTQNDVYWEQAWVSAWSLKYHNPSSYVAIVCDDDTKECAQNSYRAKSLELFNEIVPVSFDSSVGNKERSRWLKTNLRNLIRGNYLFIDADTIITDDLTEIDDFDFNIGMMYDTHKHPCPIPQFFQYYKYVYKTDLPSDAHYYSSGVIFAKDNDSVKQFYDSWHSNWKLCGDKLGYTDQTPLAKTVLEAGNPVHALSGIYNCIVGDGIKYLYKAKILHLSNKPWFLPTYFHPFMQAETYQRIKDYQDIPENIKNLALNCKSEFTEVSAPLGINEANFLRFSIIHDCLYPIYNKNRKLFLTIDKITFAVYRRVILVYYKFRKLKRWMGKKLTMNINDEKTNR